MIRLSFRLVGRVSRPVLGRGTGHTPRRDGSGDPFYKRSACWATARRQCAFALMVMIVLSPLASARPPYKRDLGNYLGTFLPAAVNDCRLCHLPDDGDEHPHNAFGKRMRQIGNQLRAAGDENDIPTRLEKISAEDADGDGVSNILEILSGHLPGDANDVPTAAELESAAAKLTAFRRVMPTYRWRPYTPVAAPSVPKVDGPWGQNPIDAFLADEHRKRDLTPRPEADRTTLLRRVTHDLTGLPPTPEELHAFLSDSSPSAYDNVVDRLVASPRYGERWGRHWMDVWRYSDAAGWTAGNQIRDSHPHVWRWRDWIVDSLNADKGYDQMIIEMLAGDEVAPDDPDIVRATGYLVRNYKMLSREKWLQDTVDHTMLAFQATTMACAKCHDHFFDPHTQEEYYRLRAVFEPHKVRIDRVPGQVDTKIDGLSRVFDAEPAAKTFLLIRGDDRFPDKTPLEPGVPKNLGGTFKVEPVPLTDGAIRPDRRPGVIRDLLKSANDAVARAEKAKAKAAGDKAAIAELELAAASAERDSLKAVLAVEQIEQAGKKSGPDWEQAAKDASAAQRAKAVAAAKLAVAQAKGDAKKLPAAEKALASAEQAAQAPASTVFQRRDVKEYPTISTGRRLAFARWLADEQNPLTARVAVNHIWLRHFGQAIVPGVFDFGKNGRLPTHPALLDHLAAELMKSGWKMKPLHRQIVTSRAYRQASTPEAGNLKIDPDNVYVWRMSPRRLEAEAIRDQLLFVSGQLDLTMGGPDIDHTAGMKIFRRSLYFRTAAERQMEFLTLFNVANVNECYERKEAISPQQALALYNNPLVADMARRLAGQLPETAGAYVTAAFERILARAPTENERTECLAYLEGGDVRRQRESLLVVLFNHHEFASLR
jgi:hypothetical protein